MSLLSQRASGVRESIDTLPRNQRSSARRRRGPRLPASEVPVPRAPLVSDAWASRSKGARAFSPARRRPGSTVGFVATGSVVGDWAYENAVVFIAAAIAVGSFILGPVRIELDRRRTSGSAELEARWEQVRFPNEKTVLRLVVRNWGRGVAAGALVDYRIRDCDHAEGDWTEVRVPGHGRLYSGQELHRRLGVGPVTKGDWVEVRMTWADSRGRHSGHRDLVLQYVA